MCLGGAAVNLSVPPHQISPLSYNGKRTPKEEISMAENESTPEYDCRDYFKGGRLYRCNANLRFVFR